MDAEAREVLDNAAGLCEKLSLRLKGPVENLDELYDVDEALDYVKSSLNYARTLMIVHRPSY